MRSVVCVFYPPVLYLLASFINESMLLSIGILFRRQKRVFGTRDNFVRKECQCMYERLSQQ